MSELDLVPPVYRRRRRAISAARLLSALYVVVCLGVVGVRFALDQQIQRNGREIEALRVERARADFERNEVLRLERARGALDERIQALEGLRGGVAAKRMFAVVDEALSDDVWFKHWSFRRAGETLETEDAAVETGYFIVLPKVDESSPRRVWRMHTHMEIVAEATDHGALASFVHRLAAQPEVESARILSTRGQGPAQSGRVSFELAVLVRSTP